MQYYNEPYDLGIEELMSEMNEFFDLVDELMEISIVGGEPFLYEDLDKLIQYLISNEKINSIRFTTNGTVVPKESVLNLMSHKKIFVQVSDYGNVRLLANFVSTLDKYNICSEVVCDEKWIDCGNVIKRKRAEQELRQMYLSCGSAKMCKTLFKGKIFDCPRAAHLHDLGYADDIEYLDVKTASKKDILDFWLKDMSTACDYCDLAVKEPKYIEPAIQMNGSHMVRSDYTVIARKNYNDIIEAKEYWEREFHKSEAAVKELQEWTKQLEEAKTYFLQKIENLQSENALLKAKDKE